MFSKSNFSKACHCSVSSLYCCLVMFFRLPPSSVMFSSPCSCSTMPSVTFSFFFTHVLLVVALHFCSQELILHYNQKQMNHTLFPGAQGHSDLGVSEVSFTRAWWYTKPAALIVDICQSLWSCKSRQNNVSRNQIPVTQNRSWTWCKNGADDYSWSEGMVLKWKLICCTKRISSFLILTRPPWYIWDLLLFKFIHYFRCCHFFFNESILNIYSAANGFMQPGKGVSLGTQSNWYRTKFLKDFFVVMMLNKSVNFWLVFFSSSSSWKFTTVSIVRMQEDAPFWPALIISICRFNLCCWVCFESI